jgi:mono/diheme cytochrome c family protein
MSTENRRSCVLPVGALNGRSITTIEGIAASSAGAKVQKAPDGALSMPAFDNADTDDEIAAVANYLTARFGAKGSKLSAQDVAELRKQTAQ